MTYSEILTTFYGLIKKEDKNFTLRILRVIDKILSTNSLNVGMNQGENKEDAKELDLRKTSGDLSDFTSMIINDYNNALIFSCKVNKTPGIVTMKIADIDFDSKEISPCEPFIVDKYVLRQNGFKEIIGVKRMPLQDVYAVMGYTDVVFLNLDRESLKFNLNYVFELIHRDFLVDGVFSGDSFYSVCEKDVYLHEVRLREIEGKSGGGGGGGKDLFESESSDY